MIYANVNVIIENCVQLFLLQQWMPINHTIITQSDKISLFYRIETPGRFTLLVYEYGYDVGCHTFLNPPDIIVLQLKFPR